MEEMIVVEDEALDVLGVVSVEVDGSFEVDV